MYLRAAGDTRDKGWAQESVAAACVLPFYHSATVLFITVPRKAQGSCVAEFAAPTDIVTPSGVCVHLPPSFSILKYCADAGAATAATATRHRGRAPWWAGIASIIRATARTERAQCSLVLSLSLSRLLLLQAPPSTERKMIQADQILNHYCSSAAWRGLCGARARLSLTG
eukprot:COSAG05_NODE_119_length_17779_cov_273.146049_16_plen_170_part_00